MRPPEGALLETLRSAARPKLSVREAARRASISPSRWTQIERGYKQETRELRVPVRAPADTLARMAEVVGATPAQLADAGRKDAADELQRMQVATRAVEGTDLDPDTRARRNQIIHMTPDYGDGVKWNLKLAEDGIRLAELVYDDLGGVDLSGEARSGANDVMKSALSGALESILGAYDIVGDAPPGEEKEHLSRQVVAMIQRHAIASNRLGVALPPEKQWPLPDKGTSGSDADL